MISQLECVSFLEITFFFQTSPMSNLKNTLLPGIPRKLNGLDIDRGPPYIRPTCYTAVSGGESVIRISLGKLSVNQLQVVKRTNTPLIP